MAENNNNEVIHYLSLFRNTVDDRRRVQIPAKWRPSSPEIEFTLLQWRNGSQAGSNILVLPPAKMLALAQKLEAMSHSDERVNALRRLMGSKSASVALDKAGRLLLPEHLADEVGIKIGQEAVLVGLVDRFEIWNPAAYEKVSAADAVLLPEALKLI